MIATASKHFGIKKRFATKAFTILELLAVLVILGIIVGVVAPNIMGRVKKANIETTKVQLNTISQGLNQFSMECGFFPSSEQGLDALIAAPTIGRTCSSFDSSGYLGKKVLPQDPWKKPFIYVSPGQVNPESFDLYSSGPDGTPDTEDDIKAWE